MQRVAAFNLPTTHTCTSTSQSDQLPWARVYNESTVVQLFFFFSHIGLESQGTNPFH